MPDIAVHACMGREVYNRLGMKLDGKAFSFGLLGPDPFLFNLPFICRYSSIMHRERAGEFLLALARRCHNRKQFSYLAGFLCHYALDAQTHPLIVRMSHKDHGSGWKGSMMHIALEHRLDVMYGGDNSLPAYPPDSVMNFFYRSVRAVYGWKDVRRKMLHGYRCMPAFYLFVRDRYGLFDKLTGWTKGPPAMISGKSSICDGIDFSAFYPLYDAAVEDAVRYIKCAYDLVRKKISREEFATVIGNRPYLSDGKKYSAKGSR